MKIRDLTGPARTAPLIVLAHSPDEVMERALRDAGADAILPANPTLEDLTSAIGDKVWPGRSFGSAPGSMRGPEGETEDGIPILSAARIVELRANIPRDELLEMVEECLSDLFHRLPALRRSLAAGSLGAVAAQAHAMVGMAGGYGMAVLEARLRAILNAVRARRLDTIEGAATVIETDLARGAAALRRAMKMPEPARSGART
jgi:hypothetical protein